MKNTPVDTLLFMMGADLFTIVIFFVILFGVGQVIFWLTRKLIRKFSKEQSEKKIKLLSRISAFVMAPVIVLGPIAIYFYVLFFYYSRDPMEYATTNYELMEEDLKESLEIGMSKSEVVELLGEVDTTQSVVIYDRSFPKAKQKYILEITFDRNGLKEYKRIKQ